MAEVGCNLVAIEVSDLLVKTMEMKTAGWRLIQACAVRTETGYELSYSYGNLYEFTTLRLVIEENQEIPSITQIYPAAFMYENEMAELFGVKINMISLDYHNKLYRIDATTPFK